MSAALEAKVAAVNLANQVAVELFPKLKAALEPFVGSQVYKADGDLMKKVESALPELPRRDLVLNGSNAANVHVFRGRSDYSLYWTVKTSCNYPSGNSGARATYHEVSVYVGNVRGQILESLYESFTPEPKYTVEGVQAARVAYAEAKKKADAAKSALGPFGEYDL